MPFQDDRGLILKGIIEHIQIVSREILYSDIAKIWLDIVLNAMAAVGEERIAPVIQAVHLHILIHKIADSDVLLLCCSHRNWYRLGG